MLTLTKMYGTCFALFLIVSQSAFAEGNVTVNNNNSGQSAYPPTPQCGGNQNNVYDPRVLPEGAYVIQNSNGSSNQLYTTGEKKPYYVDNSGCNSNVAPVQPYAFVGGGGGHRGR